MSEVGEEKFRRVFVGSLVSLCLNGGGGVPYDLVDVTELPDWTEVTLDLKFPVQYIRDDKEFGKVGRIRLTVRTLEDTT